MSVKDKGTVKIDLEDYNNLRNIRAKYNSLLDGGLVKTIYLRDGYFSTNRFDHDTEVIYSTLEEVESEAIKKNEQLDIKVNELNNVIDELRRDIADLHKQMKK